MKDIESLRQSLVRTYEGVENDSIPLPKARELANLAGKVITMLRLQIVYAQETKNVPQIPFMDAPRMIEAKTVEATVEG